MARGSETRATILRAALRLAATSGVHAAPVQAVADEAGVPKSVVLYHFDTADGLREAVLREGDRLLRAGFDARLGPAGEAGGDPKQRLSTWTLARLPGDALEQDAARVLLQGLAVADRTEEQQRLAAFATERRQVALTAILRDGQQLGAWRAPDPARVAAEADIYADGLLLRGGDPDRQAAALRQWIMDRVLR